MDKTLLQMLALLRSSLWGTERYPLEVYADINWEDLYKELKDQTVNRLVADILCSLNTPVSNQCLQDTTRGMMGWHKIMKEQQNLYELLSSNNIPFVVLKGAVACINYPKPYYRSMGDIDIIVDPADFKHTSEVLENNGYELCLSGSRHISFSHNGIEIEVHRYYSLKTDKAQFELLEGLIQKGIPTATEAHIEGYKFPMLSTCENGLVFLEHIDHHLQDGIGLRHIVDWMMYVDRHVTDTMWKNMLGPYTERLGLKTMAVVVTRMCQMYLGLSEDIEWCKDADPELCTDLMNVILARGNFGRKAKDANAISHVLHSTSNVFGTFRMLQYRGTVNWKLLETHSYLKPFAWLYQICRYIHKGFKVKNPIRSLIKKAKSTSEERRIFDKLGATKKSDGIETPDGKQY
ncbi:MAG: nucleotidyltransferase family protein [Clostridia bacterium]|nr:nucleotidyltransferase family protein [Clostridia bacterium]